MCGLEAANNLSSQHITCSRYKMKEEKKRLHIFILFLAFAFNQPSLVFKYTSSTLCNATHCKLCDAESLKTSQA